MKNSFKLLFAISVLFGVLAHSSDGYRKSEILEKRFGDDDMREQLEMAYQFKAIAGQNVFGQDEAINALQLRLISYIESQSEEKTEPFHVNLIGLAGTGKSHLLATLRKIGFRVVDVDLSTMDMMDATSFVELLSDKIIDMQTSEERLLDDKIDKPIIVVLEEIDKIPELAEMDSGKKADRTHEVISTINQILSTGRTSMNPIDFSNHLYITTMNIPNKVIDKIIENEIPKVDNRAKHFHELTLEELLKIDGILRSKPHVIYEVLSEIFRWNTVTRLATNSIIMNTISEQAYKSIINTYLEKFVEDQKEKRIEISFSKEFKDFLYKVAVYPPAGARLTAQTLPLILNQLRSIAIRLDALSNYRLNPLEIDVVMNNENVELRVTPKVQISGRLVRKETISILLSYSQASKSFNYDPTQVVVDTPTLPTQNNFDEEEKQPRKNKPVQKQEVRATRFPGPKHGPEKIATELKKSILGQDEIIDSLNQNLTRYLHAQKNRHSELYLDVLIGLPGIGKTELVYKIGRALGVPVVKVNLQQYSSDEKDSVDRFASNLNHEITKAKEKSKNGKFILLIEELDKVHEIDPKGELVNRPIMGVLKDLLNEGVTSVATESEEGAGGKRTARLDIRDAYTVFTMNFSVDIFGFEADPRITPFEDVIRAINHLKKYPATLKKVLGKMFLPETVGRLLPRTKIMNALTEDVYEAIIENEIKQIVKRRTSDKKGRNIAQIEVELAASYKKLLSQETIVPSEGARNTVISVQNRFSSDLEQALRGLPRSKPYSTEPLILEFRYQPQRKKVVVYARVKGADKSSAVQILDQQIALSYPPLENKGRLSRERLKTAAHEFGHAYMGSLFGMRFKNVVVAPIMQGAGGFVAFSNGSFSGTEMVGELYLTLASRAFERIFLSTGDARNSRSVLDITAGPSMDISMATETLYKMIYDLGLDPNGQTMERSVGGMQKYASFQEIPPEEAKKLGQILRKIENEMVDYFLKKHPMNWYVDKISQLAHKGDMTEKEFYKLVGMIFPGEPNEEGMRKNFGEITRIDELFREHIKKTSGEITKARSKSYGADQRTVLETASFFKERFFQIVNEEFHGIYNCRSLF